ncbi:CHAT domain-containing protein [Variovorax sp. J31P179]|uniref:CHAT domain-containing protein n=1 Tax=Variovorax sp. J31P179 TaxID=3053508 RepID=UPI0025770ED1|nr:CHAT domain-containing protein [Variovorax sp. J31P179]MDM0084564.1 CHAT domain-containing protein [Variovorax sp. J31P179]
MASRGPDITFVVSGQADTAAPSARENLKASVRVGATRDGGTTQRTTARPGEDVVELTIANGPTLVLSPEAARDLLRAQNSGITRSAISAAASDEVTVSSQLGWPGLEAASTRSATRGWLGEAMLSGFRLLSPGKDPAVSLASAAITMKLDGAVDPGVYQLTADALPKRLKDSGLKQQNVAAADDGGQLLILVHGTFVDTISSFGKLWELHPQVVRDLFGFYRDRVYALDHPTMSQSPIANALTLATALPSGARLHLLTHSRGGLVAEVLARACGGKPLGEEERALFADRRYAQHLQDLDLLVKTVQRKGLKVERVVRAACPARGTLLASNRLDAYLSVLKWALELGGVPVAPELVGFLNEVARRRADPTELPGLEAMTPDSPVVAWLNAGSEPLPGELRVVAGDLEGDSIGSWVKTLLSDAFYWTDNDLIVQTRSMYGGCQRRVTTNGAGATFLLDRGAKVSHFNYFSNDRTVSAIASALLLEHPAEFEVIGPLSWAGQDASGVRGARAVARSRGAEGGAGAADRPAIFVLPGILGSNLKLDGKRIWLGFRFLNGLKRLAWDPATAARVEPDGPIDRVYEDLIDRLADTHEVIPFAFDWRRPMEDEARRLADAVDQALIARASSRQPVQLIAHSMGGLVARTMQLERPDTWQRLMARDGARLLMLGTPNAGSWAPMQTLSGDDTFGNSLVAFGSLFDNGGARKMMAAMPGFIQLQAALLDPALGLDKAASWQKLADDDMARLKEHAIWHDMGPQQTVYEWGAPPQAVLDRAVDLRKRLDAQAAALGADAQKILLVVGHADFTPAGISLGPDGLTYVDSIDGGDGRVVLSSALLPGVKTWKLDAVHGKLPQVSSAFPAYIELLATGDTHLLETFALPTRGLAQAAGMPSAAELVHSRPSRGLQSSRPPSSESDLFGLAREAGKDSKHPARSGTSLQVSVYNGDLKFVREALLLGHYRSIKLTGTEAVVDGLVNKSMSQSLDAGLYPDPPGSHQIFGNVRDDPDNVFDMARPKAAIVAGLGEEGKLRAVDLVRTVRQAILAYAHRVAEHDPEATQFEMAVTLMGSGGTGINAGTAAQQIAQGALEANLRLQDSRWPFLGHLRFVELYLERAADAWRALQLQEAAAPNRLKLTGMVQFGPGALKRTLDSSYRGAAYDFISALTVQTKGQPSSIAYTLDTKRARTEVRAQHAQSTLLRELVEKASNDANQNPQIGRTLFNLLIPVEMEPFLSGTGEMVIEVDPGSAVIPWELLDTNPDAQSGDKRPWSIRCKLLRKLRLDEFRAAVTDASVEDSVLVIGEPRCDPKLYPRLPGARAEAVAVAGRLGDAGTGLGAERVRALLSGQDDAQTIINALFERPYRIVHVAGHGSRDGGVVLSGTNTYLGANEVRSMRIVPELVFLNCCHLAGRDADTVLKTYDRAEFAANIAEELIRVGVRCVIAAGWAVEDGPAEKFATTFYASLLGGARFIEAVSAARTAAWRENPRGNTWAAYQCYGDPEWAWRRQAADGQKPVSSVGDPFASVASPVSLQLALENLAIGSEYDTTGRQTQLDKVRYLESRFAPLWGGMGPIAEAFGLAYASVSEIDKAIYWYGVAVDAPDSIASFKVAEQLGNLLVRRAENSRDPELAEADFAAGISLLERLVALRSSAERQSLLGSAQKRLSMAAWRAKRTSDASKALAAAIIHYREAEAVSLRSGADNLFYPAKNCIACELRKAFLEKAPMTLSRERVNEVRKSLQKAAMEAPDFWSVVGLTELSLIESVAAGKLASNAKNLIEKFGEHKARVPSTSKWDSVYNEALFMLEPYFGAAAGDEKRAAEEFLKALKTMAKS